MIFMALVAVMSLSILCIGGCSKDESVTPSQPENFSLSIMSSNDSLDVTGTLVLDSVKILIKDIKLNVSLSNDSTNFKTGPYVIHLALDTNVNVIGSGYIPVGTYDKIQFEVHKLSDNVPIPDPEFAEGGLRFSVVARGTYNGVPFVYKSDKSAKQKLNFPNALVVTETGSNVTLLIRPYIWFIDSTNQYMDPSDANNRDEIDHNIKENIKASFKAYKDNNEDGVPD